MQKILNPGQLEAFYHDQFVEDQIDHFLQLMNSIRDPIKVEEGVLVDVGGGVGYFALAIKQKLGCCVRVIDMDPASIEACRSKGIEGTLGDAISITCQNDENIACFNLILHHLVGKSNSETYDLQSKALSNWNVQNTYVFVNEYIYESFIDGFSSWLIYQITSNAILSALGKSIAKFVPSFKANTFGVGVRFRSHQEWVTLFEAAGFRVLESKIGTEEPISPPLRLMLIKHIRRDSFLLEAAG